MVRSVWNSLISGPFTCKVATRADTPELVAWAEDVTDPGLKGKVRVLEKCRQRKVERGGSMVDAYLRCCDLSRFTLLYTSCGSLLAGLRSVVEECGPVEVKNRFKDPTPLGYRAPQKRKRKEILHG